MTDYQANLPDEPCHNRATAEQLRGCKDRPNEWRIFSAQGNGGKACVLRWVGPEVTHEPA